MEKSQIQLRKINGITYMHLFDFVDKQLLIINSWHFAKFVFNKIDNFMNGYTTNRISVNKFATLLISYKNVIILIINITYIIIYSMWY